MGLARFLPLVLLELAEVRPLTRSMGAAAAVASPGTSTNGGLEHAGGEGPSSKVAQTSSAETTAGGPHAPGAAAARAPDAPSLWPRGSGEVPGAGGEGPARLVAQGSQGSGAEEGPLGMGATATQALRASAMLPRGGTRAARSGRSAGRAEGGRSGASRGCPAKASSKEAAARAGPA